MQAFTHCLVVLGIIVVLPQYAHCKCGVRTTSKSTYSQIGFKTSKMSEEGPKYHWEMIFSHPIQTIRADYGAFKPKNCESAPQVGEWDYAYMDDINVAGIPPLEGLSFDLKLTVEAGQGGEWCFDGMFLQNTMFFGTDFNFYYSSELAYPVCLEYRSAESSAEIWWSIDCRAPDTGASDTTTYTECKMEFKYLHTFS